MDSKPIEITIFIRSDDPVRKSIGEILVYRITKNWFYCQERFW